MRVRISGLALAFLLEATRDHGVTGFIVGNQQPLPRQLLSTESKPRHPPASDKNGWRVRTTPGLASSTRDDNHDVSSDSLVVEARDLKLVTSMSGKQRQTENQKLTQKAAAIQKQLLLDQGSNLKTWDSLVPLMIQWAKLGQAEPMEAFFQQIIKDDNIPRNIRTALQRCRLHAWSNRLRLVPPNSDMAKEATEQAAQALQNMMDDDTTIVVDLSSDFATVVKNYLSLEPLDWNVIYKVWKQWQEQVVSSSSAATTAINALLTAKIIRTLANHHHSSWQTAIQYAQQAMEIGSSTIVQHARVNGDDSSTDDDNLIRVYNAMLEVYSKILPPPSKQQQTNDSMEERQQLVGEKTSEILQQLKDNPNVVVPNDQTYATAMYAYCKCAWLPQAWEIWDEWNDQIILINNNHHLELDARCLQMLIQSSVRQADTNHDANDEDHSRLYYYANRTTQVIYDMWALYDRGYPEFQPDRDLYTSVLRCWANPRLSTSSLLMDTNNMETVNALVANLNERAMTLSSLQPDMALYKEWMAVVRGHFGGTTTTLAAKVAEQAGMIVKQMEVDPFVVPDTSVYNFLMDACLSDGSMVGVTRAEQTLTKMMENSSSNDNNGPNGRSFANIIRSWLAFDTAKAEQWLDRMEERFIPSKGLFQDVISRCCQESSNAHNNKKGEDARRQAERAHRLLNRMEELSKATDNPKLRPDKSLYDRVVEAWEALGAGDEIEKLRISQSEMYAEEAESTKKTTSQQHAIKSEDDVRKAMKQLGVSLDGNEKFQADTLTFNRIIRQLASAELPQGGQIAEEIFVYMLDQYLNHANVKLKPDIITFNTVILAHSKSKNPERCKRFLKNLQELHDGGMLLDIKADLISYNTVIHAYQRSNIPNAGQEAERVFDELSRHLKPDAISLSGLLGVYAAKGDPYRAEELLLYFYKQHTANRHKPTPDTTCFDQVLLAWAKKGGKKATGRAEMLLKLMEDMASAPNSIVSPTTTTYNIVLNALSRSGDQNAPLRALGLLERMKAKLDKRKPWKKLARPCSITYTTLIAVICRLSTRRALETVELLLDEAINSPDIKTDCMFFSSVLSSLASCGEQGTSTFAKNLIERRMPDLGLSPDISCWNGLLNTFAKRGMGEEAEETLEMLEKGLLGPNVQSYSIVLDAYAKSRDPVSINRAESLIERMNESTSFKPDAKAFTALIQKYARSNLPQKAKKAQTVLERMKEGAKDGIVGMRPTVVTYNAVLNACEYTNSTDVKEQEEAFAVGCVTFDEVRQEFRPTHTTYGSFLGVVSKLMPKSDARNEIAELVFKRCCKDGQVSAYVLRKLKATVSLSQYRQMLRGKSEERLPRSWTANVMERRHERAVVRRQPRSTNNRSQSFVDLYSY